MEQNKAKFLPLAWHRGGGTSVLSARSFAEVTLKDQGASEMPQ